jgi:L-asparaginase II
VLESWGDITFPIFPRSAVKPIQALPLIASGAADHFSVSNKWIALACASHSGEPQHVSEVSRWLQSLGLSNADLECGAHAPRNKRARERLRQAGESPRAVHNNCSGKHTGFLCTAVHLGEDTHGYIEADHPVQQRVRQTVAEVTDYDLDSAVQAVDGCGIPTIALPLQFLAYGMARFGTGQGLPSQRVAAIERVREAMLTEPFMVAGSDRFCTHVMRVAAGEIVVKTGAEGVFAAALPSRGIGIALKIDDGHRRASETAMAALLRRYVEGKAFNYLDQICHKPVANVVGKIVGEIRPADEWLQ